MKWLGFLKQNNQKQNIIKPAFSIVEPAGFYIFIAEKLLSGFAIRLEAMFCEL